MGNTGSKVKKSQEGSRRSYDGGRSREGNRTSRDVSRANRDGSSLDKMEEGVKSVERPVHRKSNSVTSIPPSMVRVEPRSPILKPDTLKIPVLHHHKSDSRVETHKSHLDVHPPLSRSSSYASSLHSRRSGGSGGTTAFTTPMNSPGILTTSTASTNKVAMDDYFSQRPEYNVPFLASHSANDPNRMSSSTAVEDTIADDATAGKHHHLKLHLHSHNHTYNTSNEKSHIRREMRDAHPNETVLQDCNVTAADDTPTPCAVDQTTTEEELMVWVNGKRRKMVNIDETIQKLLDAGYSGKKSKVFCLKNSEIVQICVQAREIFMAQPSLLELSTPVKIVGDVHGQFSDLLRLFTKCGFPPASNYLFLGDYVDRGKLSLETMLLLLCYKIKYPENFFLLRGNHECANVTRVYGFYDECKRRSSIKIWKTFVDTFNTLPLAAIVAGKIFCVHGGLSPVLNSMDEIRHVSRPTDVPDFGLINDLLWSDPIDSPNEWEDNERGVSYCYNKVAINKFLNKFGFDLICRAHMVVEDGYEFFNDRSLVTVFSAPNYCGEFDNWGAVMSITDGLLCSFELLDPLDSASLKQVMKKGRQERKMATLQQQHQIEEVA